jgi:hypothetical protein
MIDATLRRLRSVQFEGKAALLCLPALALTMGYGLFTGDAHAGGGPAQRMAASHSLSQRAPSPLKTSPQTLPLVGVW